MQVRRVYPDDITAEIHNRIYTHCIDLADTLTDNELSRHYDWLGAARYLTEHAPQEWLFFLRVGDKDVGLMSFTKTEAAHFNCPCFVDTCLYIEPEHRNFRSVMYLLRNAVQYIEQDTSETSLVFLGNTLGPQNLKLAYLRLGFKHVGSHFVREVKHE